MRVVIAVLIGFAASSSVLGQTSPYQRGTPVIPINRAPTGESVVVTRNQAWQVQATDHFDIYHQAPQRQIDAAALEAERAYARISANMNHELTARMPLILVANDADLPTTADQAYRLVAVSGAPIGADHLLLSEETIAQRPYWVAHVSDRHWGHVVFDYIASQYGADGVRQYIEVLGRRPQSGGDAIEEAFSTSPTEFNRAFEAYARNRFQ